MKHMRHKDYEALAKVLDVVNREMITNMTESLYGDNAARTAPPTFPERWRNRWERAKDAWLVLTGRLDPYEH